MGKAAKSKREEAAPTPANEGDGYQFQLPKFDEQAFIRREVLGARASFYVLGVGFLAGLASVGLYMAPVPWQWGWLPIVLGMVALRPILRAMKFPDDVTTWKALLGSFVMLFFTALSIWILGVNLVSAG